MTNKKVKSNVDVPYYLTKGKIYNLEHEYDGSTFKQFRVNCDRGFHEYIDATYFEVIE